MSTSLARASAWPVNAGAYRRSYFSVITAALIPLVAGADIATVAALIVAGAADLGLLIAKEGERGLRAHLRTVITWTGWALAVALLALAQVEGSGGDLQLGSLWLQLDSTDWLLVAGLLAKTVLQTVVPNALPRFAEVLPQQSVLDVPEPPRLASGGVELAAEGVTGIMPALTPAMIASLDAARQDARGGAAALPTLPAPRAVEEPAVAAQDVLAAAAHTDHSEHDDAEGDADSDEQPAPEPEPVRGLRSRRAVRAGR